jgi:C4-dicarboxylate transporter DctQ subunit
MLRRGKRVISNLEEYGMLISLILMFLVVFIQVFFRFVLKSSLVWTEELTRLMIVWLTFLGLSCNVRTKGLTRVEFFVSLFPPIIQRALRIFGNLCFLIVFLIIMWQGVKVVILQISTGRMCSSLAMPIFYFSLVIPLGFFFSSIYLLEFIWTEIRNFRRH